MTSANKCFWLPGRIYARKQPEENYCSLEFVGFKRPFNQKLHDEDPYGPYWFKVRFPLILLSVSYHDVTDYETSFHPEEDMDKVTGFKYSRTDKDKKKIIKNIPFLTVLDAGGNIIYLWLSPYPEFFEKGIDYIEEEEEEEQL